MTATADEEERELHPFIAAHRLQRLPNFRDVSTASPRVLRPGLVFRSATPSTATAEDIQYVVGGLGLRSLVDLRSAQEAGEDEGDKLILKRFIEEGVRRDVVRRSRRTRVFDDAVMAFAAGRKGSGGLQQGRLKGSYRARGDWDSVDDPAVLRAEIYRLEAALSAKAAASNAKAAASNAKAAASKWRKAAAVAVAEEAEDEEEPPSTGFTKQDSVEAGGSAGKLLMLRPLSGKWRSTWCTVSEGQFEYQSTERESRRGIEEEAGGELVTVKTAWRKRFISGTVQLLGATVQRVPAGAAVEHALCPGVELQQPVPAGALRITSAEPTATYYLVAETDADADDWLRALEFQTVQRRRCSSAGSCSISSLRSASVSEPEQEPRTLYRAPYCDKGSMARALIGIASGGTRLRVAGQFISGNKDKAKATMLTLFDSQGLRGCYRIILEYNGDQICRALKIFAAPASLPALVHCSHGKDRTGVTCALILALLGATDDEIADDYHLSEAHGTTPAAVAIFQRHSPLLRLEEWTVAPRQVMLDTLAFIREKWGGVPAYCSSIGFGETWQRELRATLGVEGEWL